MGCGKGRGRERVCHEGRCTNMSRSVVYSMEGGSAIGIALPLCIGNTSITLAGF